MRLRYLGTAAAEGCPALFCTCPLCTAARQGGGRDVRTRSQVLVDDTLLIDFPADTYHHALSTPELNLPALRHLLITHSHADHFYPLDLGLRCSGFAAETPGMLTVYGSETVARGWEATRNGEYAPFAELSERVRIRVLEPYESFDAGGYTVTALPADHKRDELCLLYAIEKEGKRLLYANDTGIQLEDGVWEFLKGRRFDAVSMDCTAMDREVGRYHMGLPDNRALRTRLLELGAADGDTRFAVTHFSHFGGLTHAELQRRAAACGFETAYDGMVLEF